MKKTVNILGINFDNKSKIEYINDIRKALAHNERQVIFTPNPEMIMKSIDDTEFSKILNEADILLPDGIGIIIASRILRAPIVERVTGIDTAEEILSLAKKEKYRVFLLGAKPEVAESAKKRIEKKYDGIIICGTHHGYFEKYGDDNEQVLRIIRNAAPDILFVCFGSPIQEKWISDYKDSLKSIRLFCGLGGCLDVWSGNIIRAPLLIQKIGLEWLWRSLLEPARFKKNATIVKFLIKIVKLKLTNIKRTVED